jgi:tetratricopeptide (TPR) repeat protein
MTPQELNDLRARALAAQDDLDLQLKTAYACDRFGTEEDAVVHYDLVWGMRSNIPFRDRAGFFVGYGSTLRNVGRFAESLEILGSAVNEFPNDRSLQAFLALSQLDSGKPAAAVAPLLDALISMADRAPDIAAYCRALGHYRDELRKR